MHHSGGCFYLFRFTTGTNKREYKHIKYTRVFYNRMLCAMASTGNSRNTKKSGIPTPILHYPLNGNIHNYKSGTAVTDSTLMGSVAAITAATSATGTASLYNTSNNTSYLKLPSIPANTSGYTFSLWFNFVSLATGMIFTLVNSFVGTTRIFIYWSGTSLRFATMNNQTQFSTYLNTGGVSTSFVKNKWYHVVWTLSTNSTSTWYVNNIAQASFTTAVYISSTFTENRILGDALNGVSSTSANAFVNDFRYYNAILSPADVSTLYNVGFSTGVRSIPGCILWFDANDPNDTGIQPVNGTSITSWKDKSGLGNNATNVGTVIYNTTGLNGLPSMTMNTSCNFTGAVSNTNNTMTIFGVCNMDTTASQIAARLISLGKTGVVDSSVAGYMGFLRQSVSGIQGYRAGATTPNEPVIGSVPYLFETWFDNTKNYNTVHQGSATAIKSTSSTGAFAIENFCIGMSTGTAANGRFSGFISEIVVYNTALTTTQRQYIEGYLSWKWNLQGKLAPSHPYNSICDYTFKINAVDTTVPLSTTSGYNYTTNYAPTYPITNTGTVTTTAEVGSRTNVLNFLGTNCLRITYSLPVIFTRTFWLSSTNPNFWTGNVFTSAKNPVYFGGTSLLRCTVNFGASPWTNCNAITTQTSTWLFYAITQTSTSVSLYVNRVLEKTITGTTWAGDTGNIGFGATNSGNSNNYSGYMYDIRLYPRELVNSEISMLYNEYVPIDFVFQIKSIGSVPTETTPGLGYTTTYPITNIGATGLVSANTTVESRPNVFTLSGANYLKISNYLLPVIFTRTFWVSTATPGTGAGNVFSSSANPVYFAGTTFLKNVVSTVSTTSTIGQTATWLFYAITQTATMTEMYVNGILRATSSTGINWVGETGTNYIQIGAYNGGNTYTGSIDDIRVYARVLSSSEIQNLYSLG